MPLFLALFRQHYDKFGTPIFMVLLAFGGYGAGVGTIVGKRLTVQQPVCIDSR
jgi:hypothetical protein